MAQSVPVKQSNERLFFTYCSSLKRDDLEVYTATVDKLTGFLSDHRAYYFEARPIVRHHLK